MNQTFQIETIGTIRSPYKTKIDCPIQGKIAPEGRGRVELLPDYERGLETIETFSHLYLFYVFDRAGTIELSRPNFLDDEPHGVFASRYPCRPNSLGMTVVELMKREGCTLFVKGLDVLDETPLIDIKPYIPRFDLFEKAANGWTADKPIREKTKQTD